MAVEAYVSQQKNQLLDSLENQVRFSQLVAVVTGDKGIGKSFLVEQLQKRVESDVLVAAIDASLAMNQEQLAQSISLQLGLSWQEAPADLELRIQQELSQKVLIAIDDAHLLSASCLEYLLQLNQNQLKLDESVLFVLLAGDISLPGIISELKIFEEHQDMCVVFQINPIRQHETQAMLADFSHDDLVLIDELSDEKKLNYFWQLSKGNPAELQYHLNRWLEENSSTEIVEVSSAEKTSYLKSAMYVVIAVVLLTALIFQDNINSWVGTNDKQPPVEIVNEKSEISKSEVLNEGNSSKKKNVQAKNSESEKIDEKSKATQTELLVEETPNESESIAKLESEIELKSKLEIEMVGNESSESIEDPIGDLIEKQAKKKAESEESPNKESLAKVDVETKVDIDKSEVNETSDKEKGTSTEKLVNTLTKEELNLLAQDSKLFVLQWVGVSQQSSASAYVKKHALGKKMIVYRRSGGNKLLYLVISGQFLSRLQADVAKAEYKKRGYQGDPWVKSMRAVQNEIRDFEGSY